MSLLISLFVDFYQNYMYNISPTYSLSVYVPALAVISYSLIGVAVFMGKYDNMSAFDLASSVSIVRWLRSQPALLLSCSLCLSAHAPGACDNRRLCFVCLSLE